MPNPANSSPWRNFPRSMRQDASSSGTAANWKNWNTSPPRPDSAWCRSTRRTRPPPARGAIPSTRSAKPDNTGAQDADVTSPRDYGSGVNIAKRGARYLGHKTVRPTPPKGHATPKRPPVRHKRPDEKTRELLTQITSGTGKGPESLWAKTTPLEWHIPSTATIENTRNRLALANQRDRAATGLRQKPQPPHSR